MKNTTARVEHEASTSKIGEDQIFYCNQRGLATQDAVNMIVNGFCKEVFRELPMEFAVEAQKLLGVSLEGSVGYDAATRRIRHSGMLRIRQTTMKQAILEIKDLTAGVEGKQILKGINLTIYPGEVHAIMGPNGSGKSTLAAILAGRDGYEVTARPRLSMTARTCWTWTRRSGRARGCSWPSSIPVEIPGVNSTYFLKSALNEIRKHKGQSELDAMEFLTLVKDKIQLLELNDDLLRRSVNEGFSGGEKKRNEIFQMAVLEPRLAVLDETDSGLDIDALKDRLQRREQAPAAGQRATGHHALPAAAELHRAGLRARAGGWPDRPDGRQKAGAGAGGKGLRLDHQGRSRDSLKGC